MQRKPTDCGMLILIHLTEFLFNSMKREEILWFLCPRLRDSSCQINSFPWILERLNWCGKHCNVKNKESHNFFLITWQNKGVMQNWHITFFLFFCFQMSSLFSATTLHSDPNFLYYVYKIINLPFHPSKKHTNIFTMFFNNEFLSVSIDSWGERA